METNKNKMEIIEIETNKINLNPNNPRKEFDKEKLKELAKSIKSNGLINPITIKKIENSDKYELICGERRFKAHQIANIKTIPAIIKKYSNQSDELIDSLIENLHRDDLTSIERENFIDKLWKSGKYKSRQSIADAIGVSRTLISSNLDAKEVREETNAGKEVSTRTLKDLAVLEKREDKKMLLKKLEKEEISSQKICEAVKVVKKSPADVKNAFYKNKITLKQADKIADVKNDKLRSKLIATHENLKSIEKNIERNIKETSKQKNEVKSVKTKEVIEYFRANTIENQKTTQQAIRSLTACIPYMNIMDDEQIEKLKHFHNLFELNLSNALELSEKLKEKIEAI